MEERAEPPGSVPLLGAEEVRRFVPARREDSRKGDNGKVLVVGGSGVYHGAPVLASLAALRCGTDLVYAAVPGAVAQAARCASPDLIVIPMADQKLTRGSARKLAGRVRPDLDSAALGMGLAVQDRGALAGLARGLASAGARLVLDASALVPEALGAVRDAGCVVTPHDGEFRRLFGQEAPARLGPRAEAAARAARGHGVTVLLKGPADVISDGERTFAHAGGAPAMTVGGTGDVLAGLAAGMLAKNADPLEAASAAAYFCGAAGRSAQDRLGLHVAASDLCGEIPAAMKEFDGIVGP